MAYRSGAAIRTQLEWFDRSGKPLGTLGTADDDNLSNPRISPDGRRVAVQRAPQGNFDVWLLDGTRSSRLTFDPAQDADPLWSPDGSRISFGSNRKGKRDIYVKPSSGAGAEQPLLENSQDKFLNDWSPDGRFIFYNISDPQSDWDLWVLPLGGDRKPYPFLKTNFSERWAAFSPDGRWVAYMSNESGRMEIYVRPFVESAASATAHNAAGQWQVSTAGGIYPRWRSDGKELYYIDPMGQMMAAPIVAKGTTVEPSEPVPLFQTRIVGVGTDVGPQQYDVARDGRFLITTLLKDAATPPITLILNWHPPKP